MSTEKFISLPTLNRKVGTCIFDFDGTLYPSSAGIEGQIKDRFRVCAQQRLKISEREVRRLLHKYRQEYRSSVLGLKRFHGIDPFEFYEELYGGIDISDMVPKPGLKKALEGISSRVPLYILSNSNRSFVERGLIHIGLRSYFTEIFSVESNDFIRKPHQEVYVSTLERIGMPAESVCVFDDIPSSLQPAKEMGFVTVLVGNGLRSSGFLDLHTRREYAQRPEWCDYAVQDIAKFISEEMLAIE